MKHILLCLALVLILSPVGYSQGCQGQQGNATLYFPHGNLGNSWLPALGASPGAIFSWYVDTAPGDITFPGTGTVCLGLTPNLFTLWDGLAGAPPIPGSGMFALPITLPADPLLHGVTMYSQFIAIDPNAPNGLAISNPQSLQFGLSDFSLPTNSTLSGFGTTLHRAIPLQDPRYTMIVGGGTGNLVAPTPFATCEMYDHYTRTFLPATAMAQPRVIHTATRLQDGRILVTGGIGSTVGNQDTAEVYDPATGTWTPTLNNMQTIRAAHTATLLQDGRVLVAGGNTMFATGPGGSYTPIYQSALDSTDIYDPATNSFTNGPPMLEKRLAHSAVRLNDGRVLFAGGISNANPLLNVFPSYAIAGEIYDPSSGTFTPTGVTPNDRMGGVMELLPSGNVLYATGGNGGVLISTNNADLWEQSTNTWTLLPSNLPTDVALAASAQLANGEIAIFGGGTGSVAANIPSTQVVTFSESTFAFTARSPMPVGRASHTVSPLPDGSFLIVGGLETNTGFATNTAHIWNP